jgi:hypothetical protein
MSTAWSIAGEFAEACSCAYLCPCITSNAAAAATEGFCTFAMTYRIDIGQFGAADLAGVTFALIAQSKAVMAAGGWVLGLVVDASASDAQADAVAQIVGGGAGGPLAALAPLIAEFRGVERHPIRFETSGTRRTVTIPGVLEQEVNGVPSIAPGAECLAVENVFHPANTRLALAIAAKNVVSAFGLRWDDQGSGRNAHFASFAWSGTA